MAQLLELPSPAEGRLDASDMAAVVIREALLEEVLGIVTADEVETATQVESALVLGTEPEVAVWRRAVVDRYAHLPTTLGTLPLPKMLNAMMLSSRWEPVNEIDVQMDLKADPLPRLLAQRKELGRGRVSVPVMADALPPETRACCCQRASEHSCLYDLLRSMLVCHGRCNARRTVKREGQCSIRDR